MPYPLVKITCLGVNLLGYYISFTPPQAAPTGKETYGGDIFKGATRFLSLFNRTLACVLLLCEIIVVFATAYPIGASEGILQTLCPANHTHDAARLSSLPLAVMIATAMSAIGTLVRVWCFRTLGRLFTFELSVRPDHVLATRGPYAYVRHPSYTACTLVMAAFVLTHFAPGSWESECAVLTHAGWGVPIVAYLFVAAWATLGLWRRGPVEDAKMREHFGAKWVEYRQRVRWGYIPFVY